MAQQAAPTSSVKSTIITGLDATPIVRPTYGQGGAGRNVIAKSTIQAGATDATTVAYRMVRVPTNSIIKTVRVSLELNGGTATTFSGACGLLFSDTFDGTVNLNQGVLTPFSSACFAIASDAKATNTAWLDITFANAANGSSVTDGFYLPGSTDLPIWLAITQGSPGPLQTQGAWAGVGATSGSTMQSYHLTQDPGGFFDLFWQPSSTNSISKTMSFSMEVAYTTT